MLAVWSHWSAPSGADFSARWPSVELHLMSWVLSVSQAKKIFSKTALITDERGFDILVRQLGLRFDEVSVSLDDLPDDFKRYWALGKLHAYKMQKEPFIHIDSDVYFWKAPPKQLITSDVFAQNTENIGRNLYYKHEAVLSMLRNGCGWIPEEVAWYAKVHGSEAICCGILGGNSVTLLNEYASMAIEFIYRNHSHLSDLDNDIEINVIVEQYFLSAFLFHKMAHSHLGREGFTIEYLFSTEYDARMTSAASTIGYTHVLAGAKSSPIVADRLSSRIQTEHLGLFDRCRTLGKELSC